MAKKIENVDKGKRATINWLLGTAFVAWISGIIVLIVKYLIPPNKTVSQKTLSLGTIDDIIKHKKYNRESGSLIFSFSGKPAILIKSPENQFRAFSASCTHLNCIVEYQANKKIFFCNCHGGKFDLNGKNIAGPPPKPLEEFLVTERKNEIIVSVRPS